MHIEDIPTQKLIDVIETLRRNGWKKVYEYNGYDAWIDCAEIHLSKNGNKIQFFWNNWTEGEIKIEKETEELFVLL